MDEHRTTIFNFIETLCQLTKLLKPIAHVIKCLESSLVTPVDVYVFLLAILVTYNQMFTVNNEVNGLQGCP
jgi:hypothetical protein